MTIVKPIILHNFLAIQVLQYIEKDMKAFNISINLIKKPIKAENPVFIGFLKSLASLLLKISSHGYDKQDEVI